MSKFCIVLGESGSGKSTSIKTLNPKETLVINVLGKSLPFKGSMSLYNGENKNLIVTSNWENTVKTLDYANGMNSLKNIVIDDAVYIMRTEFFDRSKERGLN